MIHNMNPIVSGLKTVGERSPLIDQLARRADANRDGQITRAELDNFLSDLTRALDSELERHRAAAGDPPPAATSTTPVLAADLTAMTRAQASALLRQALETTRKVR